MNSQNDEIEIDLREIFLLILHHFPAVLAAAAAGAFLAGLISVYALTPMYTSTAKMYILTNSDSMVSLADLQMGSSLANDYEELIKSRPVVETVAENLNLDITYRELLSMVSITNPDNTRIIRIQIDYPDPVAAKKIANEFVCVAQKQISQIMKIEEPTVVEEAVEAEGQSSPNNKRNILIGALLGLILAVGFLATRYILDDTVKNADDVEKLLGLNTLASVPEEGGTDNSEKKQRRKLRGIRKGEKR